MDLFDTNILVLFMELQTNITAYFSKGILIKVNWICLTFTLRGGTFVL